MPDIPKAYIPIYEYIFKKDFHQLIIDGFNPTQKQQQILDTLLYKAKQGMPVAYLTNQAHFYRDIFYVNPSVLIPRPESEYLVEHAITYINSKKKPLTILDLCTGSGCIGISVAKYVSSDHQFIFSDISKPALEVCKKNAQRHLQGKKHIQFIHSNLFASFPNSLQKSIDIILTNPPYIPNKNIKTLQPSVRDYEPHIALDGGIDGMDLSKKIMRDAKVYLSSPFLMLMEIEDGQGEQLTTYAKKNYPKALVVAKNDLFGKERYLEVTL